jgi:hypothetical protein
VGPGREFDAYLTTASRTSIWTDYDYRLQVSTRTLEVPARYFERCMERCEQDPWLGNISGKLQLKSGLY